MRNFRYNNYHKHDHHGNPWSLDVVTKEQDYCKRAIELGHTTCFTVNHGVTGSIFHWMEVAKKYDLKMCYGTEAYYTDNRFEQVRSGKHLIIIAKNNDGAQQLNDIMSEAHTTGFYYRPRVDKELVMSLNPNDVIITTACVAGIWDDPQLILSFHRYFGNNFFLELQSHNMDIQKEVNAKMLELHRATGINIIHANDSHYIYPEDSKYRNIFLKGKNHSYEYEDGMILDYPDTETIFERYKKQGILTEAEVEEALENTLIFDDCQPITIINDDIKLPSVSDNPTRDLKHIINLSWIKEMDNIPSDKWDKYLESIRYEMDIIERTHMENYFLIDYNVAKLAQEKYGGRLTNTGRGSAPSFYITKMLGLTDIDRIASPITLFPTRFMSVERILGARSLPDIDLNTSDREPFIKATEELLGKENCAWMLAWKPMQDSNAFRVYCKGIGLHISEYDDIAKNLDDYADDRKWGKLIKESKKFVGVVEGVSQSPCSMLLYDEPVRRKLGLVRTKNGKICCLLDGYNCDKYKFLKNDYLSVTVWAIIKDVCEMASIPIPTIRELDNLLDKQTFDIYKNGLTCTINQADSDYGMNLAKEYCPKSVSEMSAFVAILRPGCASLLRGFVRREPYSTGVQELDAILEDSGHRLIYQESIMKYLIWLGIPETSSYDIIKKIAKKKFKEPELAQLKQKLINGWMKQVGKIDGFEETWTVVEQAAHYSFNASHSLSYAYDSLYGAYLKAHYPLQYYTVVFNYYNGDMERTAKLKKELSYFGINLKAAKFRYSKSEYTLSKEDNSIYKGIASIKNLNANVANEMYQLRNNKYESFMQLLFDLKEKTSINSRQIKILVELDFFEEFGNANYLLGQYAMFNKFYGKKQVRKDYLIENNIPVEIVSPLAEKETGKMLSGVNMYQFLCLVAKCIKAKKRTIAEKVKSQVEHLGYIDISGEQYNKLAAVIEVNTKYSPKLKLYSLRNGTIVECKIGKKTYKHCPLQNGDLIRIQDQKRKAKLIRAESGNFEPVPGMFELWITRYEKVQDL